MTITMLVALTILFLIFLQRPIFAGFIECSDDYFADYQVYGPCIAQKCGRFVAQLPEGILLFTMSIYRLWIFDTGDTKLERFGTVLENKMQQEFNYQKDCYL